MCGVIGFRNVKGGDVAPTIYFGLLNTQNRAKEGAGIVVKNGRFYDCEKGWGTVEAVFTSEVLDEINGDVGIGHIRYSTAGEKHGKGLRDLHPIKGYMVPACKKFVRGFGRILGNRFAGYLFGKPFFIAHNGNLVNADSLRDECRKRGYRFRSTTDTEVIAALIYFSDEQDFYKALAQTLPMLKGSFTLVMLYGDDLIGVSDPGMGNRPLFFGEHSGLIGFASENPVFEKLRFSKEGFREMLPGEVIVIDKFGRKREDLSYTAEPERVSSCIMEHIYFSRPDMFWRGISASSFRRRCGALLYEECPADADIVCSIPDSGNHAASGFAEKSGIRFEPTAISRSHQTGRSFLEPLQHKRELVAEVKFIFDEELIRGKSIAVVDDSLIRGTVSNKIVKELKDRGAREVHIRIAAPPTTHPCFYGIDTPTKEELGINKFGGEKGICEKIGADSLGYLSLGGLKKVIGEFRQDPDNFCFACFSGEYPVL